MAAIGFFVMIAAFVLIALAMGILFSFAAPKGTPLLRRLGVGLAIGCGTVLLPLILVLLPVLLGKS